jgi:hypothetical protein
MGAVQVLFLVSSCACGTFFFFFFLFVFLFFFGALLAAFHESYVLVLVTERV